MTLLLFACTCMLLLAFGAFYLLSDPADAMSEEPTLSTRGKD